ncbi:MAG: FKBP-type peptidyl-prolyl cis-trans isomerase [Opitutaceae bacterium]|nr:FKBP-type peptidyl-prolyl cis-trans isomerase [Opitutaceae bacterium]
MKLIAKLSAGLAAASLCIAVSAEEPVKFSVPNIDSQKSGNPAPGTPTLAAAAPAASSTPQYTEAQIMETFGWFMGGRLGLVELGFSASDVENIIKGIRAAASGKPAPYDVEKIGPVIDKMLQAKNEVYTAKIKQKSLAEAAAFFTKLKENKNVVETPTGLRYEILQKGSGPAPALGQTVVVHYTGKLLNDQVFDSSVQRGQPIEMPLREGEAIPGWIEGMQKLSKGTKARLYLPPHLAYGDEGQQGIPPASTLIFDVELLDVKDTPKAGASVPAGK